MTADQFNKWVEEMTKKHPYWTDTFGAKLLGVSRRSMLRYKKEGAGRTVALACQCLIKGLKPYE